MYINLCAIWKLKKNVCVYNFVSNVLWNYANKINLNATVFCVVIMQEKTYEWWKILTIEHKTLRCALI